MIIFLVVTSSTEQTKSEPSHQSNTESQINSETESILKPQPKPTTVSAMSASPISFSFSAPPGTSITPSQNTLFGGKSSQPQLLFGGQSSLTPIKSQPAANPTFEQTNSTPISKIQTTSAKNLSNDKYTSIFSALKTSQSSVPVPTQVKPIILSTPTNKTSNLQQFPAFNLSTTTQSKSEETVLKKLESPSVTKQENTLSSISEVSSVHKSDVPSRPTSESSKIETEIMLQNMIKEECHSLAAELRLMTQKGKKININLGSGDDKIELLDIINNLEEFLEEITEISAGEYSEVRTYFFIISSIVVFISSSSLTNN